MARSEKDMVEAQASNPLRQAQTLPEVRFSTVLILEGRLYQK